MVATINLTDRHMKNKNFPDKAIDVMRSAVKLVSRRPEEERIVTESDIRTVVSNETCIPLDDFNDRRLNELNGMPKRVKESVIGQDIVVDKVCDAVIRGRLGMSDNNKPIASFIFAGSSGVGKTLLSSVLGSEIGSIVEVDMSYYKNKNSVSDFIGTKLYGSKSGLCDKVWKKPYSVVVLDKIEKACPEIIDIVTSIIEKGYILSSDGPKIDFTNTIIILTTNIGEDIIINSEDDSVEKNVVSKVKEVFNNGLCEKVDDILVFKKLSYEDIRKITSKCLLSTSEQFEKLKIKVEFDDQIAEFLSKEDNGINLNMSYVYKRIKEEISTPILNMIVSKKVDKYKTIKCVVIDNKIQFNIV